MKVKTMDLATMSRNELDDLFRTSTPGPIPAGRSRGTAMLVPGSAVDNVLRGLIRALVWKGKVFRPQTEDLKNLLSPAGIPGIRARVYQDKSWFDNAPAIILDYSKTSIVARMIRDEIRQVAPGVYLGQIFVFKWRIGLFMLEFPSGASA
ncbi:MAG: hypothetical protein ACREMQ_22230 [Longimicrobiales bacterium]